MINPYVFDGPRNTDETISLANANGYLWSYLDTKREDGVPADPILPGWSYAWLEYTRRNPSSRMAIREAFREWKSTGTLPGLD